MSLEAAFDTPESKRIHVRRLFATIADRYDLITVLFSYGRDRHWKKRLVQLADIHPGERALDLAAGTGDITYLLRAKGAATVGLDVTHRMLEIAVAKARGQPSPAFLTGDMMALPFRGASFEVVTTGYGLRNVPELGPALEEIARVLKPGGRFLSLDFNRPDDARLRRLYLSYLARVGSVVGWVLHGDPDTYRYIPESIRRYPGAYGVAALLERHGFEGVSVIPLLGGLMTLHAARRR
ncbi:MAG: ubiquinone/menaquinone biosynthesis methyltransferase [Vicinamibacterales bacterium]